MEFKIAPPTTQNLFTPLFFDKKNIGTELKKPAKTV